MTTLLVHEFRRTRFMLGVIAGIAAVIVLAATALMLVVAPPIGGLIALGTAMSLLPVVVLALAIDYWRSAYGRGGYLTHSYPVRGSTIYLARVVYGVGVTIATTVFGLILVAPPSLLLAGFLAPPGVGALGHLQFLLVEMFGSLAPMTWVALAVAIVGGALFYLLQYYFAASVGSEGRLAALGPGGPLLVWVVLYLVTQVLTFVAIMAIPYGLTMTGGSLDLIGVDYRAAMTSGGGPDALPFGMIPLAVALAAVLAWRTAHSWNRKVTLR